MLRTQAKTITALLQQFLRSNGLETPLREHRLIKAWPEVVAAQYGEAAGRRLIAATQSLRIENQTLHVSLTSPALRQQLRMTAPALIAALNEAAGAQIITSLAPH